MSSVPTYRPVLLDGALLAICAVVMAGLLKLTFAKSDRSRHQGVEPIGQIEHRINEVRSRADGTLVWQDLDRDGPVYERDAVYAGPSSEVVIAFGDGSRIEVDQNSLVVIQRSPDTRTALSSISIDVLRGGASGKVGKGELAISAGDTRVKVEQGGEANLRLAEDHSAKIDVAKGRALVQTQTGFVAVKEGQRSVVDTKGEKAASLQQLSLALVAPAAATRRFIVGPKEDVVFRWKPHVGVDPYVFELSRDAEFRGLIAQIQTDESSVVQRNLEPGIYYWRVSRKLQSGHAFSEDRKLVLVLDAAPILFQPRDKSLVDLSDSETILFSWSEVRDVGRYQFQLAQGTDFDNPAVQSTVDRPSYRIDKQWEEGRYCFRVRSKEEARPGAPWSEPSCFRVITKPLFRAPKGFKPVRETVPAVKELPEESWFWRLFESVAYADTPKSSALTIRWEKIPGAPAYLIEIAEDQTFEKVVVKKKVKQNYYRWHTVVRRPHYWRVRVVDEEGREGEVSHPIRIDPEVSRPVLAGPPQDKRFELGDSAPRITLQWKGSEVLNQFVVEVAKDASFAEKVVDERAWRTTKYVFKNATVGEYFWRVTGIDLLGVATKPSAPRRFSVHAAAPQLLGPRDDQVFAWEEDVLSIPLRWSERPASSYEIQIAGDAEFTKVIAKLTSSKASLQLKPQTMGRLYWRVRGASPKTPWSDPLSLKVVPAVPHPMTPTDGTREDFEGGETTMELRWDEVPHVTIYDVEVVRIGEEGEAPPETQRVEATAASLVLKEGRYRWTVRAVHPSGASSQPSSPLSFELAKKRVEAVTPKPVFTPPKPVTAVEAVVDPSEPDSLYLGPLVGFQHNLGAVIAPRLGLEIAFVPPVLSRHLRVALSGSYLTSKTTQSTEQGDESFESRLHGVPVELTAAYIFYTSILDVSLGGGLSLNLWYRRVEIESQPTVEQTDVEVGGVVVAGAARTLGPGSLSFEVSYVLTTRSKSSIAETAPGGLGAILGYYFGIR